MGQLESQLGVVGLLGGGEFEIGRGGGELAASVVGHAEQHAGLKAGRVGLGGAFEGGGGLGEPVQLEVGEAEVEVDAREFRIEGDGRLVVRDGELVFTFVGEGQGLVGFGRGFGIGGGAEGDGGQEHDERPGLGRSAETAA